MAWNAHDDILRITDIISNISFSASLTETELISVSIVAHDAYANANYNLGQLTNLSQSFFNVSTVNLSLRVQELSRTLVTTNASLLNLSNTVTGLILNPTVQNTFDDLNVNNRLKIGSEETTTGSVMYATTASNTLFLNKCGKST